jgi:NhaP-type Na+/H+ and K+/H+ antiporter
VGEAADEASVKSALLPEAMITQYTLFPEGFDAALIGKKVGALGLPKGVEVAALIRFGVSLPVEDELVLEADDQLTLVGPAEVMPAPGAPIPASR